MKTVVKNNSSDSKKSAIDWLDILGKFSRIFQSLVIGIITLYITTLWLPVREEKNRKNEMKTEIMSAREQASLSFRGEMFDKMYTSIVASKNLISITERVEKLRLFQEYFNDVFDGRPFFECLYKEAQFKNDTKTITNLVDIARENTRCQENHIKECYDSTFIKQDTLKLNDSDEIHIDEDHCIKIKIGTLENNNNDITVSIPVTVYVNEILIDEIKDISYFHFPFSQNYRLSKNHRIAFRLDSLVYTKNQCEIIFAVMELKNDFLQTTHWLPLNELVEGLNSIKGDKKD